MEKLKAVIYIRISDESQKKNNSLETQLNSCKAYANSHNYDVVQIFKDEAFSAKHVYTRPDMKNLLEFCTLKKNKISAVVIYKMDRWSRNVEEGLVAVSLLAKYGIAIIPASEITEQNPIGTAVRTILMTMGQLDNELKGERVRDNMKTMFHNGYWCWKPPLGYKRPYNTKEENKGKLAIPNGRLSELIKLLFQKAAETPSSKKYLADYINRHGFKEAFGKKADGRIVSSIISDTFYFGKMYSKKWDEYAWGKHEPLLDEIIWNKAYVNVFNRSKKYSHQDSTLYPLKGPFICGNCAHALTSSNPKGHSKKYLYYECHNKNCSNKERIRIDAAHEQFAEILKAIKPTRRVLKLFTHMVFAEWDQSIDQRKHEALGLEKQITDLEDKLTSIAESNSKRILTDDEATERAENVRNSLVALRTERADIRIDQYETEAVKNFTEEFLLHMDKLWKIIDLPLKQALQNKVFPNKLLLKNGIIQTSGLASTFELIEDLTNQNVNLVPPSGFEPEIYALRRRRPRPLDDGGLASILPVINP
jgi:site-specific DNA recombinase